MKKQWLKELMNFFLETDVLKQLKIYIYNLFNNIGQQL